jgi:predicted DNA-binding transcriptional regulator AlpA
MRTNRPEISGQKIGTTALAARFDVCTRSIDRWLDDPDLGFPQPIYINRRRFWDLAEIESWERNRARAKTE